MNRRVAAGLCVFMAWSICLIFSLTSCKKYPEGPLFSLLPRKIRLCHAWTLEQYLQNGNDKTTAYLSGYSDYSLNLSKDGFYTESWFSLSAPFMRSGTWEFQDNQGSLVLLAGNNGAVPEKYEILKLMNRFLWLKKQSSSGVEEFHYKRR